MFDYMRQLHPRGAASRGICVDAKGVMLGPDCVLVSRTPRGFYGIDREAAAPLQKCLLGADRYHDWLFQQCQRIADALNRGEVALAQIYGLRIPIGDLDERQLARIAGIGLAKAGFNPAEPRIPKGDPHGGEWTNGNATDDLVPDTPTAPSAEPLLALDVASSDTDGSPPMEFRIVSPDTETAPHKAGPESSSSGETGITSTSGTEAVRTVGEREVTSHRSPGDSGGGADYHGDAINPDYTFENLLLFFAGGIGGTGRALARALIRLGITRAVSDDTHHIVAQNARLADPARKILERFGIDLDDPANGVFLSKDQHSHLHKNVYYNAVNKALAGATTKTEAEQILRSIARQLEAGTFP
jgi:hypothetical protein